MKIKSLSIVVPAYNEEKRILKTIKVITDYFRGTDYELIIIDDGSKDKTADIISKMSGKNKKIILLKNGRNRGKGYSVKKGVMRSHGDAILFTDADLSTPISEYTKLKIEYVGGAQFCIGSRRLKDSMLKLKQPLHRRILGRGFGVLVNLFAVPNIKDTQCGFKLYNAKSAKKVFSKQIIDRFGFDVEILYLASKNNIKIKEIPVIWSDSPKHSKVNIFRDAVVMFGELIKIRYIHR